MSNAKNKHRNIRRGGHVKTVRYHDLLRARRTQNPLSGLNPARVRRLYELYREGKYADVQLAWDALEEYDDMLGTVLNRRQAALGEMEWKVLIDADAVAEEAAMQALAEAQQGFITRRLRAVENLSDAIKWLGLADFRRYSALELLRNGETERWLPIHHWLLCRPALEGAWCYNENAESSCARVEPIDMQTVILREVVRPIDLSAMFLISAKEAAIDGWDSFLEVFGNPALFFKMPPGTSDERRDEYASIIKEISSDGAGVYPDGGEIHTVETSAANADAFSSRAEWCDKALVRRATGGLLTVLAESGSGTLAGSAHMEAFRQIAANDAGSIAECINRQYVRRRLAAQFPGQPVLVYFTLTPPVINDRSATVDMLCKLAGQGWRATDEAVSEEVGMEVHTEDLRLTNDDLRFESSAPAAQVPVMNSRTEVPCSDGLVVNANSDLEEAAGAEPPLTEGELAALRLLGGGLNAAQVAADAEYMAEAMRESTKDKGQLTNDGVLVNSCNQYAHEEGCDNPGADEVVMDKNVDDKTDTEESPSEKTPERSTPVSVVSQEEARPIVGDYKKNRMKDAQKHAKSVLPREVNTPLKDAPRVAMNGSDIKEMLNTKAVYSSVRNGVNPVVHEEAVLRTPALLPTAKEVSRRSGGKKDKMVIVEGKKVVKEDPVAEIVELDAVFKAKDGQGYTARYSVQKYKKPNMQPKVYFMYCRK